MDPYSKGLIPNDIYSSKITVRGKIVSIMNAHLNNRDLKLIKEPTRAFRKHDLVEIIATDEVKYPGENINSIAYIGFTEILNGGVIRRDDTLLINEKALGKVLGFDATHAPNHYNLIVHVTELVTGKGLELSLGDLTKFVYK